MTEFWKILLSSFLGAALATLGGYFLFKFQENRKLSNAKASMHLELSNILDLFIKTQEELNRNEGYGKVQVITNKIYREPSEFLQFKAILTQLPKSKFESIGQLYQKITEFEETRSFLIDRKVKGIEVSELIEKKKLSPDERTTIQFMRIYEAYFRNLDLLISEIEEVKRILE